MSTFQLAPRNPAYPVDGRTFPNFHVGGGAQPSKHDGGFGVEASITSTDAIWRLRFDLPSTLPSTGSPKLRLRALSDAATGSAPVNPKWAAVSVGSDPSSATLSAEGTTTVTWASGDNDKYKEVKIPLDAGAISAGQIIIMDLTFEATGWNLAQVSTWIIHVIWE